MDGPVLTTNGPFISPDLYDQWKDDPNCDGCDDGDGTVSDAEKDAWFTLLLTFRDAQRESGTSVRLTRADWMRLVPDYGSEVPWVAPVAPAPDPENYLDVPKFDDQIKEWTVIPQTP